MKGDFILQARGTLLGAGVEAHRKFGWMIRTSLDSTSAMVCAALHVIASPVGPIQRDTSLMVIAGNKKTEWSADTKNNETTLVTSLLKVIVELSTGRIKFHDVLVLKLNK